MRHLSKLLAASLLAAALTLLATPAGAQTTNKAAIDKKVSTSGKKPAPHPFHGKLTNIDKAAKTITVGKTVYHVGSETRIKKDGKPATLEEGVLDQQVTGYVKPNEEGKMVASSINFGGKAGATRPERKSGSSPRNTQKP